MDHVGPLCKSVEDAALMLSVLAGFDPEWSGSVPSPKVDYAAATGQPTTDLRVGVARIPFLDGIEPEVLAAFEKALDSLRPLTASLRDVVMPHMELDIGAIFAAETYGFHRALLKDHGGDYQPTLRAALTPPKECANPWSVAADYADARRDIDRYRLRIKEFFGDVDLVVLPTMRYAARKNDAVLALLNAGKGAVPSNTRPFDILGLPAISVPCGFTAAGLPVGLQIVGAPLAEDKVLRLASAFEKATPWRTRKPRMPRA
jgi:aspartyl-tRNA(Asn)/glutamyl-tRNA(Gln) amidotransferase subunit A